MLVSRAGNRVLVVLEQCLDEIIIKHCTKVA